MSTDEAAAVTLPAARVIADPDNIEHVASQTRCYRHIPQMRACRYEDGKPCLCRLFLEE